MSTTLRNNCPITPRTRQEGPGVGSLSTRACRRHTAALLFILASTATAFAASHPRLLVQSHDLPRLRHACGIGIPDDRHPEWGRQGRLAADYQSLRAYCAQPVAGPPLPGEVSAAACVHLLDPTDTGGRARLALIADALRHPDWITQDALELVLALDWCWDDLPPDARHAFIEEMLPRLQILTTADSPLNPRLFADQLAALALAIAVDEQDEPTPVWRDQRRSVLTAARLYFEQTFPAFVAWRGCAPTGADAGPQEERDTVLALELASQFSPNLWAANRATVGRWLEHYAYVDSVTPPLPHHFLHDDGSHAPLWPGAKYAGLQPLTAPLLAARTHDPAAVWVAAREAERLRTCTDLRAAPWRWVLLLCDVGEQEGCDAPQLPAGRNLDGTILFRSGTGPDTTLVWIEAGQPLLRRRQHFDAGHFLVYHGGFLVGSGGDDVTFEAVPNKGGDQRLGPSVDRFDFEQYFTASISHNCIVAWDSATQETWYGARYVPVGGQRLIEDTCSNFVAPLEKQGRMTGRTLAFGTEGSAAYVALDLTPAYGTQRVAGYTREFIFLAERALIVVDRVKLAELRTPPTWLMQLPIRPRVDGAGLSAESKVDGRDNEAGVWRVDAAHWLHWTQGTGQLWLAALAPQPRSLRVVGGPAHPMSITGGAHTGRRYVGGEADGYERLVMPLDRRPLNAWYRLGSPTLLGPAFEGAAHWGRIELEPANITDNCTFITVLVTDDSANEQPPVASLEEGADGWNVRLKVADEQLEARLSANAPGGTVRVISRRTPLEWRLPQDVTPAAPLPTKNPTSQPAAPGQNPVRP